MGADLTAQKSHGQREAQRPQVTKCRLPGRVRPAYVFYLAHGAHLAHLKALPTFESQISYKSSNFQIQIFLTSDDPVFSPSPMATIGWHKGGTVPFGGSRPLVHLSSHPNYLTHPPACRPLYPLTLLPRCGPVRSLCTRGREGLAGGKSCGREGALG